MATLLVRDAAHVETFDDADRVLRDASIFVRDGAIEALGPAADLPRDADRVVDARGARHARRRIFRLAENALSDLGPADARRPAQRDRRRLRGVAALGVYDRQ